LHFVFWKLMIKRLELPMLRSQQRAKTLGMAITIVCVLAACGGGEERQTKYLERAQQHYESGDLEKTRIDVKNVLQINANNAEAYYLMAQVEEQESNWRAVFGNLSKAVELNPDYLDANVKLGEVNIKAGNVERAGELAEISRGLSPDDAGALGLSALVELRKENPDQAEEYALASLAVNPAQESAISVIYALYYEGQPELALPFVDKSLIADPDSVANRVYKIKLSEILGQTDVAIEQYLKLIEMDPENIAYSAVLANYYVEKERLDDAEQFLRGAVNSDPENDGRIMLLVNFLSQNIDADTAVAELERMLTAEPENYVIRGALGNQLIGMDEIDRAKTIFTGTFEYDVSGSSSQSARNALIRIALSKEDEATAKGLIEEVLEIEPENPEALVNRALIAIRDGNNTDAILDLRVVLRANPESVRALLLLAEAYKNDRSMNLALDSYRSVLDLAPNNTVALYQSALIMAGQQNYTEATKNAEQFLVLQPNNVQAVNLLSELYSRQDRWSDAEKLVSQLAGQEESSSMAGLMQSNLELKQGNYDRAIELAHSALDQNSALTGAIQVIANAYVAKGDTQGAIDYVSGYLEGDVKSGPLYAGLAQLYAANGDNEKAIDAYGKAIELAPEQVASYMGLIQVLIRNNQAELIVPVFEKGIAANPENTLLKAELSSHLRLAGEYDRALELLDEAYALDSKSLMVRNNLAALLIDWFPTEDNLRRAQEMTRGFESSGNASLLDTLGWLQYKLGDTPQAVRSLEAAQAAGGQGDEYWYHLGLAYHKDGQLELAKEQLGKVVAAGDKDFYGRAEAEKIYKSL
jgi:tetratricopeptide (TPR) repeat protein